MQVLRRAAVAMAFALPLGTLPLTAQNYRWDFFVNGGYSWLTGDLIDRGGFNNIVDGDVFDDFDNIFDDVSLGDGGTVGSTLGYWFSRRIGLRANFAYTDSDIDRSRIDFFDDDFIFNPLFDPFDVFDHDVNLWGLTGDLMIRLNTPRSRWDGFEWLPYIALGLGANWINPSGNGFFIVDDFNVFDDDLDGFFDVDVDGDSGIPLRCQRFDVLGIIDDFASCAFLKEGSTLAGLVGVGMDLRIAPSWAIRLEFGDRIYKPDVVRAVRFADIDPLFPNVFQEVQDDLGNTINQLYLTAGVGILFGLEEPPRRVVVAPRPAPPPPPATEEITVCVIDPMYAGGVRNLTATRHLTTGDTTIIRDGQTVNLHELAARVPVASNASWYISGAPLEIGTAPHRLVYVTIGGARVVQPDELVIIGNVNGMPVFVDRMTAPGGTNLGVNTDLNSLITTSADARAAMERVSTIYVPLQATGCVFQAMQKQVEVRKKE